jgi:hypothetical protein
MKTTIRAPRFKSESQEAEWWDAHRDFVADTVMKAIEEGSALRGVGKKLARDARVKREAEVNEPCPDEKGRCAPVGNALSLQFRLDPKTYSDPQTVKEMTDAFPAGIGPRVSKFVQLTESVAGGQAYMVLTVVGATFAWLANRVLGPTFDELGSALRDAVKSRLGRSNPPPDDIGYWLTVGGVEVRIGIKTTLLLSWNDSHTQFQMLREYLIEWLPQLSHLNPEWVTVCWDASLMQWTFVDMWPKDMNSTHEYYVFDSATEEWIKRSLR